MKRKYEVFDIDGNWLGNVFARTRKQAFKEAKADWNLAGLSIKLVK